MSLIQAKNVSFLHPSLLRLMPQYNLIRDCLDGEVAVKAAKATYLPRPNADDKSDENSARYESYLKRAVFYNVSRQTMRGVVGQVFSKPPEVKLPDALKAIIKNADGTGASLEQQAKKSLGFTAGYSRGAVFLDYPDTSGGVSAAELASGLVRPTLHVYGPHEITNWRVVEMGAEEILSLVVLLESYTTEDDGFEQKFAPQYRVLRLVNGVYTQEIWREPAGSDIQLVKTAYPKGNFQLVKGPFSPQNSAGQTFDRIPFWFTGSDNNDSECDQPNFYDICSLNVAHYRNSADYEESCYVHGQATPVVTGLTQDWLDNNLKGKIRVGALGGIPLPTGATAELLQSEPNGMIVEAMTTKERQMVALGARLFETTEVERTATEVGLETASENSIIASTANNVSTAFESALKFAALWVGASEAEVVFKLNTDFEFNKLTPEARGAVVKEWQAGAIGFGEMRTQLRRAGIATEPDATVKSEFEAKQQADHDKQKVSKQPAPGAKPVGK